MLKKYWLAALALALAIGFAVAVAAQPVIAEMKGRWYESWVDFIYDSNPATSGETVVARFDGANTRTILPGDIRVCDTFDGCPTFTVATANGEVGVEGDGEFDGNLDVAGTGTFAGDVTFQGNGNAITMSGSTPTIDIPNNSATALDIESSGGYLLRFDTQTGAYSLIINDSGFRSTRGSISDTTALDSSDCGRSFAVTAGINTKTITLPDADAVSGCELTFSYIGADAGALVDISPLDSDADGIEGGCYETTTDTVVYFSGTADADIGLTAASALTGDWIKLWSCDNAMWCVVGCQGIWANN